MKTVKIFGEIMTEYFPNINYKPTDPRSSTNQKRINTKKTLIKFLEMNYK